MFVIPSFPRQIRTIAVALALLSAAALTATANATVHSARSHSARRHSARSHPAHGRSTHRRSGHGRAAHAAWAQFTSRVFANGASLHHTFGNTTEALADPDDITYLNGFIYVGFQNGVGPQGQPSSDGNVDSTIVKFNARGKDVAQWDVVGKCDGLTADPLTGKLIATVNEDANSSLYLIDPNGSAVQYQYNDGGIAHGGGTDAIEVYGGMVLISASAPGTSGLPAPQPTYPAVYEVTFDAVTQIATLTPLFYDEGFATEANVTSPQFGRPVNLYLTDPDSNEDVPSSAARFGGDFMLTSQGDEEQIFVSGAGSANQALTVLQLSASVDDTAWPSDRWGTLYADSTGLDTVDAITGPFQTGRPYEAVTPCDENSAPATCPGPGYPANSLGELNPWTGVIRPLQVSGAPVQPQGMLFLRQAASSRSGRAV